MRCTFCGKQYADGDESRPVQAFGSSFANRGFDVRYTWTLREGERIDERCLPAVIAAVTHHLWGMDDIIRAALKAQARAAGIHLEGDA